MPQLVEKIINVLFDHIHSGQQKSKKNKVEYFLNLNDNQTIPFIKEKLVGNTYNFYDASYVDVFFNGQIKVIFNGPLDGGYNFSYTHELLENKNVQDWRFYKKALRIAGTDSKITESKTVIIPYIAILKEAFSTSSDWIQKLTDLLNDQDIKDCCKKPELKEEEYYDEQNLKTDFISNENEIKNKEKDNIDTHNGIKVNDEEEPYLLTEEGLKNKTNNLLITNVIEVKEEEYHSEQDSKTENLKHEVNKNNIEDETNNSLITRKIEAIKAKYMENPRYAMDRGNMPKFFDETIINIVNEKIKQKQKYSNQDEFEEELKLDLLQAAKESEFKTRNLGLRITADILLGLAGILPLLLVGVGRLIAGKSFLFSLSQAGGNRAKEIAEDVTNNVYKKTTNGYSPRPL